MNQMNPLMRPDTNFVPPKGAKQMIVLEYENHGASFANTEEVEYEETCKVKQGHLAIVTSKKEAGNG